MRNLNVKKIKNFKNLIFIMALSGMLLCGCEANSDPADLPGENPEIADNPDNPDQAGFPEETDFDPAMYPTSEPPEETLIPDSTDIDPDATSLEQFVYEIHADGTAVILDFTGSDTELVITSQIGGYPVTEIGQYAFEASWDVTSVTLPDTIRTISEQAFADCEMLSEINIPESVTTIGRGAFSNCISLTSLTIPESVTSTDEEMLTNCLALEDLTILNPALSCDNWGLADIASDAGTSCVIHAPAGSKILDWAEENNFQTEIIY